jgi:hypothetical protein
MARDLEATRYAADRAFRQYDAAHARADLLRRWPRTLMPSGRHQRRMRGSRSGSCEPSSTKPSPISMTAPPRSC